MTKAIKVTGAFIAAPIAASLTASVVSAIHYGSFSFADFNAVLFFTYVFGIGLGLPAYFLLRRFEWDRLWHYILGGAAIGLGSTFLFLGIPFEHQPPAADLWSLTVQYWEFPFGGAIGAAVFWLIGVRKMGQPAI